MEDLASPKQALTDSRCKDNRTFIAKVVVCRPQAASQKVSSKSAASTLSVYAITHWQHQLRGGRRPVVMSAVGGLLLVVFVLYHFAALQSKHADQEGEDAAATSQFTHANSITTSESSSDSSSNGIRRSSDASPPVLRLSEANAALLQSPSHARSHAHSIYSPLLHAHRLLSILSLDSTLCESPSHCHSDSYPNLSRHGKASLIPNYLTRNVYESLKDKQTPLDVTLEDLIRAAVSLPWGGHPPRGLAGVYAGDADSYTVFADLLNPMIADHHHAVKRRGGLQRH